MTWWQPSSLAWAAFSFVETVPITVAPRAFAHWHSRDPTPPAAAWTRIVCPCSTWNQSRNLDLKNKGDYKIQIMPICIYCSDKKLEMGTLKTNFFVCLLLKSYRHGLDHQIQSCFSSVLQGIWFSHCFVKFETRELGSENNTWTTKMAFLTFWHFLRFDKVDNLLHFK